MKILPRDQMKDLYRYFEINENTSAYEATERLQKERESGKMTLGDYENILGVSMSCMDMDLYKSGRCFYLIMNMRALEDEDVNETLNKDMKEINFDIFSKAVIENGYLHCGGVGTGAFYYYIFKPLVIHFDPKQQLNEDMAIIKNNYDRILEKIIKPTKSDDSLDPAILQAIYRSIKKQIPSKPINKDRWIPSECPTCSSELGEYYEDGYINNVNLTVCVCGQQLDWND